MSGTLVNSRGYNWQTQNLPRPIQSRTIQLEVYLPDAHSLILRNPIFELDVILEGSSELIIE